MMVNDYDATLGASAGAWNLRLTSTKMLKQVPGLLTLLSVKIADCGAVELEFCFQTSNLHV